MARLIVRTLIYRDKEKETKPKKGKKTVRGGGWRVGEIEGRDKE